MSVHIALSEKDKKDIIEKNTCNGSLICAIDNRPINNFSDIEFHNIKPVFTGRKDKLSNIAVVCKKHHKELGQNSITELKVLKEMEDFFKKNGTKKLDDVIALKLSDKNNDQIKKNFLEYKIVEDKNNSRKYISIKFKKNSDILTNGANKKDIIDNDTGKDFNTPLYICPSTGFSYFYALIPVEFIKNDIELQPRPLELKRLWDLYRHLLVNSQLTPSVCRLVNGKIYLFDGQHKASAQIWAGRDAIECKVYLNPDLKTLKETNLIAHDKLRQMPFFTSVLINKWASIFEEEWKEYMEMQGEKSESSFVNFLVAKGKKRSEAVNMLESNIYDSILEDKKNKIRLYLAEYNLGTKKPLTVNRLKTSLFKKFITNPPLNIAIEQSDILREEERRNTIRLLNIFTYYTLEDMWNPVALDENHKISERIFLNGAFKAVCATLKDTIATVLELFDENERKEILLRQIPEQKWDIIKDIMGLMFSHRVWSEESQENYNNLRISNETEVRKYLSRKGLSVNWLLSKANNDEGNFID